MNRDDKIDYIASLHTRDGHACKASVKAAIKEALASLAGVPAPDAWVLRVPGSSLPTVKWGAVNPWKPEAGAKPMYIGAAPDVGGLIPEQQASCDAALRAAPAGQHEASLAVLSGALSLARAALSFYAGQDHFHMHEPDAWDTVSGEPQNFYEDEGHTATVEDGSVAKQALENIAHVERYAADLSQPADAGAAQRPDTGWSDLLVQVRDDAYERCAKVCDGVNNHDNQMTAGDCADTIRSFKGVAADAGAVAVEQAKPDVIEMLLDVVRAAWHAMDNTEENEHGKVWDSPDFDALGAAMDKLEALPDDRPGYVMGPAAKAEWAMRSQPQATPLEATSKQMGGAQVAKAEQPCTITDTTSAREFVDAWHRKHFPTDRTFTRYIMNDPARSNPLAGDFAWQLANALESFDKSRAAEGAATSERKPLTDAEPNMLWLSDDNEVFANGPDEFAEDYASNCLSLRDGPVDVRVDCAYRGHKRTMRISMVGKDDDTEVKWSWVTTQQTTQRDSIEQHHGIGGDK